ncbi:MAG: adenosylcobinamide-GDP ribazoletransferase [Methanolinea sp.]|jgi:adenosylcobinamide-GDP ribazoletransferase|nr:adenosylcobinamide-GDP ribazoletransferase [Methanolinea sp.]
MPLTSIISLLQFTTILPLGRTRDFGEFARRSWLYPLAGYVVGGIAASAVFFIGQPLIAAAIALGLLFLLTGCNHLDGLMDLGDGLMAHGDREKRVNALTDRQIGTGGLALAISVCLISFSSLAAAPCLPCALIIAEVGGKFSMAFLSRFGIPFHEGLHSSIQSQSRPWFPVLAAILCIPLVLLPVAPLSLAAAAVMMVACPTALLLISRRLFGGVNGDVVGASNEITRALVLAALCLA